MSCMRNIGVMMMRAHSHAVILESQYCEHDQQSATKLADGDEPGG